MTIDHMKPLPRLQKWLASSGLCVGLEAEPSLAAWREFLLCLLYLAGAILGLILLPPILYVLIKQGDWFLTLINGLMFVWTVLVIVYRRFLPYRLRVGAAVFIAYFWGVLLLAKVGADSGGALSLFTMTVFAGVFLGTRAALCALVLNLVTCAVFTWLIYAGLLPWVGEGPDQISLWLLMALNLMVLNALAALSVTALVKGLQISLEHEIQIGSRLMEESRRLEEEVQNRMEVETELAQSESKHRLLAETVSDMLWTVGLREMKFTYVSPSVEKLLGYTPLEAAELEFEDYLAPKSMNRALEILGAELSNDEAHTDPDRSRTLQMELIRKDGSTVWGEVSVRFLRGQDGRPNAILGVTRDITTRRLAEERLRQSLEHLEVIFESAPLGMATIDPERRFLRVNPRLCQLLGYSSEELVGCSFNEFTHPDDQEKGRKRWLRLLDSREDYNQAEKRYIHKDGSVVWALVSNSLVRDEDGQPLHFVSHLMDITGRKKAEGEKKQLEAHLRHTQKMEAVGALAGGVAHDFNNIMQAISGYAELVKTSGELGVNQRNHLDQIEAVAGRARDLVDRLLTFSRKRDVQKKPLDLSREVVQASVILERTLPKMVSIQLDLADDARPIMADRGQVEQVLLSLGGNAGDAMPRGGTLTLGVANFVRDGVLGPDGSQLGPGRYVELIVKDTGEGMDPETLSRIFEPFFTTKEVGKGTGLGLAAVYGIASNHGGRITCQSRPGEGAVFSMLWPAADELPQVENDFDPIAKPSLGRSETILIVDDEPFITGPAAEYLGQAGYRPLTASSGEEAVELYSRLGGEIDLVVLDLGMPGMGGAAALGRLMELNPKVKIIVASGYSAEASGQQTLAQGAAAYLRKPFRLPELVAEVRRILDARPIQ